MSELNDPTPVMKAPNRATPADKDWMYVSIQAPSEVGAAVVKLLREQFGYRDTDWCVLERREDYSRVDYDPMPPRTEADNEYTIDWRKL